MNTKNNTPASRNEEAVAAPSSISDPLDALRWGANAAETLLSIGNAIGFGRAQQILGEQWDALHGCAPRGSMGVTVKDPQSRAAPAAAIDAREQEAEEDAYVIDRLSKILAGVAIALKGEELPRHRHSYHDLEDVARALKLELDLYRATFPDGVPESALASRITSAAPSEALSPATVAQPVTWRDMATAPKDGTLLRLLVEFEHHATEDAAGPQPTIGSNTWDNHHDFDEWQFAGWSWEQDCYTQGVGKPVGWLPMLDDAAQPCASQGCGGAAATALSRADVDRIVYACRQSGDDSTYAIVNAAIRAALSTAKSGGGATPEGGDHG